MGEVFTIGCSIHLTEQFVSSLKKYKVAAVVDVRSMPFSKHSPQFNQNILKAYLPKQDIEYVHLGKEFGARREESEAYSNDIVDFKKVSKLSIFQHGIERIYTAIDHYGWNIALMCTEKDPIDCHRFLLVAKNVAKVLDINIKHILFDGSYIDHCALEQKMLKESPVKPSLFDDDPDSLLEQAYEFYGRKIAYKKADDRDE